MSLDVMLGAIETQLVWFQFMAAVLFLVGAILAFSYGASFPRGPGRSMFLYLGWGLAAFSAMAFVWVFEDMAASLDTLTDVLFAAGVILTVSGFIGAFELKKKIATAEPEAVPAAPAKGKKK